MKLITTIFFAIIATFCFAAFVYLFSMLFMLVWNEGPAYVFSWPKIETWWRASLILIFPIFILPTSFINSFKK